MKDYGRIVTREIRETVANGYDLIVTREIRERAAEGLSAAACARAGNIFTSFLVYLDDHSPERLLATLAFESVPDMLLYPGYPAMAGTDWTSMYAEAEARVRCGWLPGDVPPTYTGEPL